MKKHFYWFGIIGAITFVLYVVIGGLIAPHYSHVNQYISEIEPSLKGSKSLFILILFNIYNILVLIYSLIQFHLFKDKGLIYKIMTLSIAGLCILGFLMSFFPFDIGGDKVTISGIIHVILTILMAPFAILATLLGYWTFDCNKKMRVYSLITCIMIFIFGGMSAIFYFNHFQGGGLIEKIAVGTYIIWLLVTGLYYKKYIT